MKITKAAVENVAQNAQAAVQNEQITRMRVERLETILGRNLLGRLRWLVLGK
jgi:hypothetical protein